MHPLSQAGNAPGEWSRSRFWLCYFLHNRHERQPIDWTRPQPPHLPATSVDRWLSRTAQHGQDSRRHLIAAAMARWTGPDPAFVQSLRLLAKEEAHHADLLARLTQTTEPARAATGFWTLIGWLLGPRFELSVMMLRGLLELNLYRRAQQTTSDSIARDVCSQIIRDKQAHVTFCAERLTLEYADFNFIRRNLRRLRLRAMFAVMAGWYVARERSLLRGGANRFIGQSWFVFSRTLERVVPYHRDALLAALLKQRENPYAEPTEPGR